MWRRLFRPSKTLLLGIALMLVLLLGIAASQLASLTQRLLNPYLKDAGVQIVSLHLTPSDLVHLRLPLLQLRVHNSLVTLHDLQLQLTPNWLDGPMGLQGLDSLAIRQIEVDLATDFFERMGAQQDDSATGALELSKLPQIAIGQVTFKTQALSSAAIARPLGLSLDYLNLDDKGRLTSALSFYQSPLLTLNATLEKTRWQLSSQMDLDNLSKLVTELSSLSPLNTQSSASVIALHQLKRILTEEMFLRGKFDSEMQLDLAQGSLTSSHQLSDLELALARLGGQPLKHPLKLAITDVTKKRGGMTLDLKGPLTDLQLSLAPTQLELALSPEQFQPLASSYSPMLNGLLTQLTPQGADFVGNGSQPTEPQIRLTLNLGQAETETGKVAFDYNLAQQRLNLAAMTASLTFGENKLTAKLSDLELSKLMQTATGAAPTSAPATHWRLGADWQVSGEVNQALCIALPPDNPVDGHCADASMNRLSLAKAQISLAGSISGEQDTAHQNQHFVLSVSGSASLSEPGFNHRQLEVGASGIDAELPSPLKLEFQTGADPELELTWQAVNIKTAKHRLRWPSTHSSRQGAAPIEPAAMASLTSSQTSTTLGAGHFKLHHGALQTAELSKLDILTLSPQINEPEQAAKLNADSLSFSAQQGLTLSQKQVHVAPLTLAINSLGASQETLDAKGQALSNQLQLEHLTLETKAIDLKAGDNRSADEQGENLIRLLTLETLLNTPWQSELDYKLTQLTLKQQGMRLNKLRSKTLYSLPEASLNQAIQWRGLTSEQSNNLIANQNKQPSYRLETKESWLLDKLPFESQHQMLFSQALQPQQLTGQLNMLNDANAIVARLSRLRGMPSKLLLIGDAQLEGTHNLTWQRDSLDFTMALTPSMQISEGSFQALPFEQAQFTAQCELTGNDNKVNGLNAAVNCQQINLKVAAFNPGVLLTDLNANANFKLDIGKGLDASIGLNGADVKLNGTAKTLGGEILLPIFNLNLGAPSSAYLVLQGMDLAQLLAAQPQTGIYADGIFDGVLPVSLEQGKVSVNNGQLAARAPGGLIKVDDNPAVVQMRVSQPYLDFAFSALEELHYTQLSSSFDMAPNGDAQLKVQVKGRAKDIERPIHLNYAQEENMLQLLKSLQIGDRLQTEIERAMAN
ncbi:intermembrane phospholipid transport protein YdbH family protein [Shewanella sp.]|uniref:YdbH domain-containing protein n=1 Tax=Shewanella sp. TaxID=50422 RepID=UPI003D0E8286